MELSAIYAKCYVGRTTLHERITEHRIKFYELLTKPTIRFSDEFHDKDIYNLGLHLVDVHGELDKSSFSSNYAVSISMNSNPKNLAVNDHLMNHKHKSIKPFGLNSNDPFGIPLLKICKKILLPFCLLVILVITRAIFLDLKNMKIRSHFLAFLDLKTKKLDFLDLKITVLGNIFQKNV